MNEVNLFGRFKLWAKPTIFLCGGFDSHNRNILAKYLRMHKKWPVFYADDVWSYLAQNLDNSLGMENSLGEFSDVIIIIAESPGTFAEIGAFANVEALRSKLLVVIDKAYKDHDSFINTGPIRWINNDSSYGGALYVDFNSFIVCSEEIIARIDHGYKKRHTGFKYNELNDVELIYLIADIIVIFGPCDLSDIKYVLVKLEIKNIDDRFERLVATGLAMKFYRKAMTNSDVFYAHPEIGESPTTTYLKNPNKNRLKYLSKALKSNEFSHVIQEITDVS